jgi:hypothetical protein
MNSQELYLASLTAISKRPRSSGTQGLSVRTYNILHLATCEHSWEKIDPNKVYQLVVDGEIWRFRNCGEKTVKEICEWLSIQIEEVK